MKQYYNFKLLLTLCLSLGLSAVWGQITVFDYSGDFVEYVVPPGVTTVNIEALGAQGAAGDPSYVGGNGAKMSGDFTVVPGSTLIIAVGGQGEGQSSNSNGGGGGGSFVVMEDPGGIYTFGAGAGTYAGTNFTPLIIAGGGGGTRASVGQNGNPGVVGNMGTSSSCSGTTGGGTPVTAPESGGVALCSSWGSGGGGLLTNGGNDGSNGFGGTSFIQGADGGTGGSGGGHIATGGFGCGGQGRGYYGGGGGGGYSGGQGGRVAGGGGSYNVGILQDNETGNNSGDGQVTIEVLCIGLVPDIPVTGVCIGDMLTLDVDSETGGTITWDAGGGTPATDEVAFAPMLGTFTYTATSSSPDDCGFTIDISASEVPTIVANSSLPSACEGATMTVWGTGGDTYTWTGTGAIDPIDSVGFVAEPGVVTYTVIGSILGCEGPAAEVTLTGAAQPDVVATVDPEQICLGDSYTVTGSGDLVTSTYWGPDIESGDDVTPESAGTFIHIVVGYSDDGCTDTTTVAIVVNELPVVDAGDDVTVCEGDELTLTGSGATEYTWDPTATDGVPFVPGAGVTTYTVTGTDINGCTDDDEIVVTVVELPYVASFVQVDEYFGYDGSIDITVAGGSGSYTYAWSHGPTTEDVDGLTSGIVYTVAIDDITIDPGMCSVEESFTLTRFIGIDGEEMNVLNAYPNPTTDQLTVVYEGQFNYEVTTLLGQVVMTGTAVDQEQLSMVDLADGTYIVKVTYGNDISFVQVVKK